MNKSLLLLLLALCALVSGGYLVLGGDRGPEITIDDTAAWLEADEEAAAPVVADLSDLGEPGVEDAELPEGLAAFTREEVSGPQARPPLVVQVWDREKGVPAAETAVFFLDGFEGPELKDPFAQHWSVHAEAHGQQFRTDAAGRVQLPPIRKWAMVTAQKPGAYGFAKVGRKHGKVETIVLRADETVTVRVVDSEDRPVAGVPVGIVQRIPVRENNKRIEALMAQVMELEDRAKMVAQRMAQNPAMRQRAMPRMQAIREQQMQLKRRMGEMKGGWKGRGKGKGKGKKVARRPQKPDPKQAGSEITERIDTRARRRTDATGVAVFRHFQLYRAWPQKWWPADARDRFEAVLLMPLQRAEARPFAGRPVPTEAVELRLPATGSLVLRTVDQDGRPFTHPVHADLRVHGAERVVPWGRIQQRKEQDEEEIEFPFVGLGMEFTVRCRLDDKDFRWTLPAFAGPVHAGEQLNVDVVVAPTEAMLFGRLLDREGRPLAGLRPTFLINSNAGRLEGEEVVLDKDGRFHLPLQLRDHHRAPFRLEIRRNDTRPVVGMTSSIPRLPRARVTDIGEIRLDEFGRIAFGRVVDDEGRPIPKARVQLQKQRDVGRDKPRLAFVDEAFVEDRADEKGEYELFGALEPGRYRLRVTARNHFTLESRDVRAGSQLDLELLRNSKVVGTVLTPDWLPSRDLKVALESAVDNKQRRNDRIHDHRGKKYVYYDNVRPGTYNVTIRVSQFPDPVLRIDGFEIRPGHQGMHPRLTNIDLRSLLHRFEVVAVDGDGQRFTPDWPLLAGVVRPDGRRSFVGFPWKGKGGKLTIVSASPQLEVRPMASGFRPQMESLVLGVGQNSIRFLRFPPVELRLPGLRNLVGDGRIWIKLEGTRPDALPRELATFDSVSNRMGRWYRGKRGRQSGRLLGANDTVRIPTMADGRYKCAVFLLGTGSKRRVRPVRIELGEFDVRVVPGGGPQRIQVPVPAEPIRAGLLELANREAAVAGQKR